MKYEHVNSSNKKMFVGVRINRKEIPEIKNILLPDEHIEGIFSGTIIGKMSSIKTQWLVVTNTRVMLHARAYIGGGSDAFFTET